jgi:hypothetical protein
VQLELGTLRFRRALRFGRRGSACCRVWVWQAIESQEALGEHKQKCMLVTDHTIVVAWSYGYTVGESEVVPRHLLSDGS